MLLNCGVGEDLRVPWTARRSHQSIPKEMSPEYSLERLMLKLKRQRFGHLMQRADSFEKTLTLGKIEGRRRRGWQRMRLLDGITDSMDMSLSKLWEMVKNREVCHAAIHGVAKGWTPLSDWTTRMFLFRRIPHILFMSGLFPESLVPNGVYCLPSVFHYVDFGHELPKPSCSHSILCICFASILFFFLGSVTICLYLSFRIIPKLLHAWHSFVSLHY